jgi:hypothetical protein
VKKILRRETIQKGFKKDSQRDEELGKGIEVGPNKAFNEAETAKTQQAGFLPVVA